MIKDIDSNIHLKLANKKVKCIKCGQNRPLDTFRALFNKNSPYCIDCTTNILWYEYKGTGIQLTNEPTVKKAFRWLIEKC